MFNKKPKTYSVFLNMRAEQPLESAILLPDGFNLWAFLFPAIWSLYHSVWRLFFLFLAFTSIIFLLQNKMGIESGIFQMLSLGFQIWVGLDANDWRLKPLKKRGYELVDVVVSTTEIEAHQRFLDRYINNLNSTPHPQHNQPNQDEHLEEPQPVWR